MLAMGFGFSVAALARNPSYPRPLLYVGTIAAFSPLATLFAGDVYWLEWVSVGFFLIYVTSVGVSSMRRKEVPGRPTPREPV
jgi:predicted Na+-dependent transporter